MNFTREPIIETIITPKEGYKLVVRNSKGSGQEEYIVDAVEVVSFGHSFFFRSMERPKSFLVPVSDFEIIETKETRVVLKNASFERSIKIGGGKKEKTPQVEVEEQEPAAVEQRLEKKRERKRHRRRRGGASEEETKEKDESLKAEKKPAEGGGQDGETERVSSSTISRLIPPPAQLISDKIAKESVQTSEAAEGDVLPEVKEEAAPKVVDEKPASKVAEEKPTPEVAEEKPEPEAVEEEEKPKRGRRKRKIVPKRLGAAKKEEEEAPPPEPTSESKPEPEGEGGEVHRVATEQTEVVTSTSFSTLDGQDEPFGKIW